MRARIPGLCALLAASCCLGSLPARSQTADPPYSYKRPSPTTITSFQSLYDMCVAGSDDRMSRSGHSLCVGYFTGIIDFYMSVTPAAQRQFCLPTNPPLTRQQGRDKLVAWSGNNPSASAQPAAVGVYQFLVASFPCTATAP